MKEPTIVKEAFQAIGISITTTNEKRHLLKENSRALEPVLPRTNDAPHSKSTNERNVRFLLKLRIR